MESAPMDTVLHQILWEVQVSQQGDARTEAKLHPLGLKTMLRGLVFEDSIVFLLGWLRSTSRETSIWRRFLKLGP